METVATYCFHLLIFGIIITVFRLFIVGLKKFTLRDKYFLIGFSIITISILIIFIRLCQAPGGVEIFPETSQNRNGSKPQIKTLIDTLAHPWNSEDSANWPVAEVMAKLSEIAYQPPVDAEKTFEHLGFVKVNSFRDSSLSGYVVSIDGSAVIVFRGTDNKFDWYFNLNAYTLETTNGQIHRGFYNGYQSLKPQIDKILDQIKPNRIWVTGHSLGGAMALVCALDIVERKKTIFEGVMTFGQPLVTSSELAFHIDTVLLGKYARFVNENDLVARVPPNMKDCGSLVMFQDGIVFRSKQKQKQFGGAIGENSADSNEIELTPLSPKEFEETKQKMKQHLAQNGASSTEKGMAGAYPFSIDDHSMGNYIDKIKKFIFSSKTLKNNSGTK